MPATTQPPQDDSLWTKLLSGVKSAIELRVVTYVGDVEISGELSNPTLRFPAKPADAGSKTLATTIDMVQGDITTAIPDSFWAPEKEVVRSYHQAQVKQANEIVERNVKLVVELATQLKEELRAVSADSGKPAAKP